MCYDLNHVLVEVPIHEDLCSGRRTKVVEQMSDDSVISEEIILEESLDVRF